MDTIQKIIELLNKKGISGAKMSRDLGFSNAVFSQWKTGKQKPSAEKLLKMAEYLGVSADYLLGIEQKENSPQLSELSKRIIDELESLSKTEAEAVLKQIELIKSLRLK